MLTTTATSPRIAAVNPKFIFFVLLSIPAIVWAISVGDLQSYFSHHVPPGQILYLLSKLVGLYALYFMAAQVMIGIQGRKSQYFRYHRTVGILTAITVATHLGLFVTAASLRTGHAAWDNLVPAFDQGFYKGSVSYGIVAAYVMILIVASGLLMKYIPKLLRFLHLAAYLVIALGWLHSFCIGTETRSSIVMAFYGLLAATIVVFKFKHTLKPASP